VHAVRVAPELWERARAAADERGETVSDVIRRTLEAYAPKLKYCDCGGPPDLDAPPVKRGNMKAVPLARRPRT
jgi:hypothetical protein